MSRSILAKREAGPQPAAYWPATGAIRTWLAFGAVPDAESARKRDGADYLAMERRGELRTYPGRTVPSMWRRLSQTFARTWPGLTCAWRSPTLHKLDALRDASALAVDGRSAAAIGAGWLRKRYALSVGGPDRRAVVAKAMSLASQRFKESTLTARRQRQSCNRPGAVVRAYRRAIGGDLGGLGAAQSIVRLGGYGVRSLMKLPRNWAALRKAALRRAGWRSERSGRAGRLEVHHRRGRAHNGAEATLEVVTRSEHIDLHRGGLTWPRAARVGGAHS